ncbi:uncharacterized protein LOC133336578 [Musca vetustissima]|uniref:uncharacterized protein LOC133336578 n=1 Tax=Musca vetustissima TaxID=27455 RepID=UPI002AB68A20|nr:uncharacterized protein LOC133336578 [Musca vetustissima]
MSLKGLEKHGIFVAAVTILISFMILMNEISMIKYIFMFHDDHGLSIQFILQHTGIFTFGLLTAISATLLIWGIVKKYPKLIVPWLTLATLSAIVFTCCNIYDIVYRNHQWDDILFVLIIVGMQIILIYPIYILAADIRIENLEAKEYSESNEKNNFGDYFIRSMI